MNVGIIAEYNPFHNGHQYQIRHIRNIMGKETGIVAVMSGDFVQRGEAAAFSKFARAEAAVRAGVSLVLELPLPWCMASAEKFAEGGVELLADSGAVDVISFGSESGNMEKMVNLAELFLSDTWENALHLQLKKGLPFAVARENAASDILGKETACLLHSPNDLLAVEYIKAIKRKALSIGLLPVLRKGADHDGKGSASWIRTQLAEQQNIDEYVPQEIYPVYCGEIEKEHLPFISDLFSSAVLSRLRMMSLEDFKTIPDAGEGVENSLFQAARKEISVESVAMSAKSKRYALSRLRRMTMCAALGIKKEMLASAPPYIRVLAMDAKGRQILRQMRDKTNIPVLIKPAGIKEESSFCNEIFELNSRAHDLFVLGYGDRAERAGGEDYRRTPFILGI